MTIPFVVLCILTVGGAVAAMTLRNLVHCALCLAVTFAGLAAFYLQLQAQFAGFAQLLVYVGAVAILIVFAILLTRSSEEPGERICSSDWAVGILIAVLVLAVIGGTVLGSKVVANRENVPAAASSVRQIGDQLMTRYVLPLEVLGLLLTAAMIGAVVLAIQEREPKHKEGLK